MWTEATTEGLVAGRVVTGGACSSSGHGAVVASRVVVGCACSPLGCQLLPGCHRAAAGSPHGCEQWLMALLMLGHGSQLLATREVVDNGCCLPT